jgi:hypothetical protein
MKHEVARGADTRVCRVDTPVDAFRTAYQISPVARKRIPSRWILTAPKSVEKSLDAADTSVRATLSSNIHSLSTLFAVGLLAALSAHATTFYVTISGLGGEPDYDQRFKMWAEDIDSSLKKAGGDSNIVMLLAPTREQIRSRLGDLSKLSKPTDSVVLMLIGHGTFDGTEYKFNITGPDISGAELSTLLDHIPAARQLVVNMTSSSGGSIEFLRKVNRIVITATKTGTEKNATVFARYWAEALRDPAADADKNDAISALEAFHFAQRKTTEFFDTQKRLATEHSVLEDTGKGEGEKSPSAENGEGKLAGVFPLVRLGANAAAARDPAKRPLLDRKEELEQAIDKLKYEKAAMAADAYKKQLLQLMLELAKTQEALDK